MEVKFAVCICIGIVFTLVVYILLIDSLTRHSLSFQSMRNTTAASIVLEQNDLSQDYLASFQSKFVYLKGNGNMYLSDEETRNIGPFIGIVSQPNSGGNHFTWEIKLTPTNQTYYVDHITGEIISRS